MPAPPNAIESMPVAEPDQSNKEVADIVALAQQLKDAKLRNARIKKKRQDWAAEAKRKKDEKDKADRLAQEAEQRPKRAIRRNE